MASRSRRRNYGCSKVVRGEKKKKKMDKPRGTMQITLRSEAEYSRALRTGMNGV